MTLHLHTSGRENAGERVMARALEEIEREVGDLSADRRRVLTRILEEFKADCDALEGSWW
jgi:hypothetical protein